MWQCDDQYGTLLLLLGCFNRCGVTSTSKHSYIQYCTCGCGVAKVYQAYCVFSLLATVLQYCVLLLQVLLTVTYDIYLTCCCCVLYVVVVVVVSDIYYFQLVIFYRWMGCKNKFDLYFYSAFSLGACLKLALSLAVY